MYTTTKISSSDFIGNSLTAINTNFIQLENWTNSILLSSEKYFQPLVNFYDFYGDFWKSSINFSIQIDAINRLTNFSTLISTNSSKFIKPISITYPDIFKFDSILFENYKNIVINWFKKNYPITNPENSEVFFVEKSIAYVCIMFYDEIVKVDKTLQNNNRSFVQDARTCTTNNVSSSITCSVKYQGAGGKKISCVDYEPQIMNDVCRGNSTVCTNPIEVRCSFQNNAQSEVRTGRINIDEYFKDRSEKNEIYIMLMEVEGCEWVFKKFIPYYE